MTRYADHRAAALARRRRNERVSRLMALFVLALVLVVMAGLGALWITQG